MGGKAPFQRKAEKNSKVRPHTQFSPLPGVQEEGERKEEKDEKPHAVLSYLILVPDAGRQPFNIPTIPAKNRPFSYAFSTFGLRFSILAKEARSIPLLAFGGKATACPVPTLVRAALV